MSLLGSLQLNPYKCFVTFGNLLHGLIFEFFIWCWRRLRCNCKCKCKFLSLPVLILETKGKGQERFKLT